MKILGIEMIVKRTIVSIPIRPNLAVKKQSNFAYKHNATYVVQNVKCIFFEKDFLKIDRLSRIIIQLEVECSNINLF